MGLGISAGLAATVYGTFSLIFAAFLLRRFPDKVLRNRLLTFAFFACALTHLSPDPSITLIALSVILVGFTKAPPRLIPAMYLGMLLVVPDWLAFEIPFPGIAYLLEYRWWLPLAIIFLTRLPRRPTPWNSVDTLLIIFTLWVIVLDFREVSVTTGMRRAVVTGLLVLVPYFLLSRGFRSPDQFRHVTDGFFVTAVVLASYAATSQVLQWDFMAAPWWHADYRMGGLLRLGVTMSTGLMGYICGLGLIILFINRNRYALGLPVLFGLFAIFVLAILSSGARVAIAAIALTAFMIPLIKLLDTKRFRIIVLTALLASGIVLERAVSFDPSSLDETGTFEYRQEILKASIDVIMDSPIFGQVDFIESWRLAHLVQGQGIIDIVNRYAQIALQYGLIAMFLFIATFTLALDNYVAAWRGSQRPLPVPVDVGFPFAVLVAYMFFIATTSDTSYVGLFGTIVLALVRAAATVAPNATQPPTTVSGYQTPLPRPALPNRHTATPSSRVCRSQPIS